jgi:hypothetical protein
MTESVHYQLVKNVPKFKKQVEKLNEYYLLNKTFPVNSSFYWKCYYRYKERILDLEYCAILDREFGVVWRKDLKPMSFDGGGLPMPDLP